MKSIENQSIIVDSVAVDYLTLTTFDLRAQSKFASIFKSHRNAQNETLYVTRLGYTGEAYTTRAGTLQYLQREYDGRGVHAMLIASGAIADEVFRESASLENVKCTRVDLQFTTKTERDVESELDELYEDVKSKFATFARYRSERGSTVYVYSRKSSKFLRVYNKSSLLRVEFELKERYAQSIFQHRDRTISSVFVHYLQSTKLKLLERVAALVSVAPSAPRLIKDKNDTRAWLFSTVLPLLYRHALADEEVFMSLKAIVDRVDDETRDTFYD